MSTPNDILRGGPFPTLGDPEKRYLAELTEPEINVIHATKGFVKAACGNLPLGARYWAHYGATLEELSQRLSVFDDDAPHDPRAEGVYCTWRDLEREALTESIPDAPVVEIGGELPAVDPWLRIEQVAGDGTVKAILCTHEEAILIAGFVAQYRFEHARMPK